MRAIVSRLTSILGRSKLSSSSLTVGTATSFVVCAALVGVVMDRPVGPAGPIGAAGPVVVQSDLDLRGTLAPNDQPMPRAPAETQPSQRAILARL